MRYGPRVLGQLRAVAGCRASACRWRGPCTRRVRTKSVKSFDELPQGLLPPLEEFKSSELAPPSLPNVLQQAKDNMARFPNCVLLTRVGQFYEAEDIGPLLNLKVATKDTKAGAVPMAGFPCFQLDRQLKTLVQDHSRYVAISEEYPRPEHDKSSSNLFDRKISRIITPGTLIDEKFMDPYDNNYLLALSLTNDKEEHVGLAWIDLSTGDFFTQRATMHTIGNDIARINPREILLSQDFETQRSHALFSVINDNEHFISYYPESTTSNERWQSMVQSSPHISRAGFSPEEVSAAGNVLDYVAEKLPGTSLDMQPPVRRSVHENVLIDVNSMRALELKRIARDGSIRGSLLSIIRRTVTKSGARLLGDRLTSPITSIAEINGRLDLVSRFLDDSSLRSEIVAYLRRCHDTQRVCQKFALGRGDAEDLLGLARTIRAAAAISARLQTMDAKAFESILLRLDVPFGLADKIEKAIDEEAVLRRQRIEDETAGEAFAEASAVLEMAERADTKNPAQRRKKKLESEDVWLMRKSASPSLKNLHSDLQGLMEEKDDLEQALRARLNASSLTLRWTPGLSHIVHVRDRDTTAVAKLDNVRSVSSSRSTRSFQLPEWTFLGSRLDHTKLQIRLQEQKLFHKLRLDALKSIVQLRRNARVLDELDVACGFAALAQEQKLVRPILTAGKAHNILGGRHPIVEAGLREDGRMFVANDCHVGQPYNIWLVTGPNMGGKSTFLRQNALISILAQTGSYVPADYAEIGIVDQIFSRVGSADNLYRNQSTFMVEMLETASILKQATSRSLVIMDEVGRGTTSLDGLAIAFACLEHLYHVNQCRVIFATHFHELADMIRHYPRAGVFCTDLKENRDGSFVFDHKVHHGVNLKSHGIKVAQLAGLPASAVASAKGMLSFLERNRTSIDMDAYLKDNGH